MTVNSADAAGLWFMTSHVIIDLSNKDNADKLSIIEHRMALDFGPPLADEDDFAQASKEWERWFPIDPPARQGAKMPVRVPGMKVSIALIAEA